MRRINEEIAEAFVKDLQQGILKELLTEVQRDDTLILEFRKDYIEIYYRGGSISKIKYLSESCYKEYFDANYNSVKSGKYEEDKEFEIKENIKTQEDCIKLVEMIRKRKRIMNYHITEKPQKELEYKQAYIRENNDNKESNFYIVDLEYMLETGGKMDLVAVQRKDGKNFSNLNLSFIEMKYGNKAYSSKNDKARYL